MTVCYNGTVHPPVCTACHINWRIDELIFITPGISDACVKLQRCVDFRLFRAIPLTTPLQELIAFLHSPRT